MVDSGHDNDIRCHHCAGPLTKTLETSEWTVSPFIRDSFSMIGSAVGGTASAFIGFNHVMPIMRKWIKGPMWLHFLVGVSYHQRCRLFFLMISSFHHAFSSSAVFGLALASSSYQAAVLSSQPPVRGENHKMHKSSIICKTHTTAFSFCSFSFSILYVNSFLKEGDSYSSSILYNSLVLKAILGKGFTVFVIQGHLCYFRSYGVY
ncbi:hypothetical protein Bca52824_094692 [Brassica carinata]|uniref:Uncharacterized protein n=1 Tax=Brassica carinata TaxID=52824 RepID=A0A8X7P349_BRACI|nr:hypothetical protein Bca52824_094692 [Brassica carinata]